jgi:hypothetical protein
MNGLSSKGVSSSFRANTDTQPGAGCFRRGCRKLCFSIRIRAIRLLRVVLRPLVKKTLFRGVCLLIRLHGSLRQPRVLLFYAYPDFARKTNALAALLRNRGFPVDVHSGAQFEMRALLKASPDLWIGFWNEFPVALLPRNYVFLNAEPLHVKRWRDNTDWRQAMKNALEVWDYKRSNKEFVEQLGVPFYFVPFGYTTYYEMTFKNHTADKDLPQDIDVLFFGDVLARRRKILDKLIRHGMKVHVVSRTNPAYGEQLDELLARSKIVLGIHNFDEPEAQIIDLARVDHLLSNRIFVLHEKPAALATEPAFEQHVATCAYAEIPDACVYYLSRPAERADKASKAYAWFKAEYPLDRFIPYDRVEHHLQTVRQGRH